MGEQQGLSYNIQGSWVEVVWECNTCCVIGAGLHGAPGRQPEAWTGGTPLTLSVASFQVFGSRAKAAWALQSGMSDVCSPRTILYW
jgi:hypothetical protein